MTYINKKLNEKKYFFKKGDFIQIEKKTSRNSNKTKKIFGRCINYKKNGINSIIDNLRNDQKIIIPKNIKIEGGDIILNNEFIFIGYTENNKYVNLKVSRTNKESLEYIQDQFPDKTIIGIKLIKNDKDPKNNILHLDCTMQPIGNKKIIIYENGIYDKKDRNTIYEIYGEKNLVKINQEEMYEGCSNIFSINKTKGT